MHTRTHTHTLTNVHLKIVSTVVTFRLNVWSLGMCDETFLPLKTQRPDEQNPLSGLSESHDGAGEAAAVFQQREAGFSEKRR